MTDIRTDEIDELLRLAKPLNQDEKTWLESVNNKYKYMQAVMKLWRAHGGGQHGPNTETVTMPLANFAGFIFALPERLSAPVEPYVQEIHRDFGEHDKPPRGRFQDTSTPVEADVAALTAKLRQGLGEAHWTPQAIQEVTDEIARLSRPSVAGAVKPKTIAGLQAEIGLLQSQLEQMVLGDPGRGVSAPSAPPVGEEG